MKRSIVLIAIFLCSIFNLRAQNATPSWQKAIGIFGQDDPQPHIQYGVDAYATASDVTGNIYVTGNLVGKANFSGNTIDGAAGSVYIAKYNSDNALLWIKNYGIGFIRNIAAGSDGNMYVYGFFYNKLIIGNITLNAKHGNRDVFVAKIDGNGNVVWAKNGGSNTDMFVYLHGMTLTANDDILITGSSLAPFKGEFDNITLPEGYNFMVKYDKDGNVMWGKVPFASATATTQDVASDRDGNVFITGGFSDTLKFDGGINVTNIGTLTSSYIAKFDVQGNFKWAHAAGLKGSVHGFGVACDGQKNIYEFGNADSAVTFGNLTSNPDNSAKFYLAKYDSTGTIQWVNRFGGLGSLNSYEFAPQDIGIDKNNNISVMGTFVNSLQFNSDKKLTTIHNSMFIAQYNTEGSFVWANSGGGLLGNNQAGGLCITNNNDIYVSGSYLGDTATFGYNKLIGSLPYNAYLAKIADVTGIKAQTNTTSGIKVYPNPVADELTITGLQQGTQMQIFDIVGRMCINIVSTKETEYINTSTLIKGNYLLKLTGKNSTQQQSFKITKE